MLIQVTQMKTILSPIKYTESKVEIIHQIDMQPRMVQKCRKVKSLAQAIFYWFLYKEKQTITNSNYMLKKRQKINKITLKKKHIFWAASLILLISLLKNQTSSHLPYSNWRKYQMEKKPARTITICMRQMTRKKEER